MENEVTTEENISSAELIGLSALATSPFSFWKPKQ